MSRRRRARAGPAVHAALGLFEIDDLAGFRAELPARLRELIDCESSSYNEFGPNPGEIYFVADPPPDPSQETREAFNAFAMQNPLAAHYTRTGYPGTLRLSDFVSKRQLHALDLYAHVYRHTATEYQLAFTLPSTRQLVGVTVSRANRDFTDAELDAFESLRAVIASAHRTVHERAQLEAVVCALDDDHEAPVAIMFVEASGLLTPAHARAGRLLAELASDGALAELRAWAHARRAAGRGEAPRELTLRGERRDLVARYVHGTPGNLDAITLRKVARAVDAQSLRALGLTRRQSEVLHLLWRGMTNVQIAYALALSEHTVRHHLEEIYRRLGVSSRLAAAQAASAAFSSQGTDARAAAQ